MSTPFTIECTADHYVVTWPGFHNINGNPTCYNFFKILFEVIKVHEAMVIVNGQHLLTVSQELWYMDGEKYSEWVMARHYITGAVFNEQKQAILLQEELEKRYMWKLLKA